MATSAELWQLRQNYKNPLAELWQPHGKMLRARKFERVVFPIARLFFTCGPTRPTRGPPCAT
jgi:hypothetical protein